MLREDLRNWFSKTHPKGDWVRIGLDGEIKGPCAREEGEGKPKCLNRSRAESMTKAERAKAARRKRREDPVADRKGKGGKPVNVKTESYDTEELEKVRKMLTGPVKKPKNPNAMTVKELIKIHNALHNPANVNKPGPYDPDVKEEYLIEKNVPTNPKLWSQAKALAKKKFDVYPSAYANGWAAKWYKKRGGGWKTLKEERQSTMKTTKDLFLEQLDIAQYGHIVEKDDGKDHEYEMARSQLKTSATAIKRLMEKLGQGEGNLQAWVQSKLTKASDYIDSVADYMDAKDPVVKEAVELSNQVKELFDEVVEESEEETEVQYVVAKEGHKLDGEIIESYEVKSNGRVKVKTASGTGYIKEEDIALYEESTPLGVGHPSPEDPTKKVIAIHHGTLESADGQTLHKISFGTGGSSNSYTLPIGEIIDKHPTVYKAMVKKKIPPGGTGGSLGKPPVEALVARI